MVFWNSLRIRIGYRQKLTRLAALLRGIIDLLIAYYFVLTPEALFERIESYVKRMENGEFFDEERDYEEYHRNEYHHYRNNYDYYEEDTDFSTEEYFIYGFSFKEAFGESFYNNHKIQFLRTFYLSNIESDQTAIFSLFIKQHSIYLSDKYCFNNNFEASKNLKHLIYSKASHEAIVNVNITEEIENSEIIAINRVRHILKNKLRGGYESSCMFLVACAEVRPYN